MKATGKINKRAQRKWLLFFFRQKKKDPARCWQYYRIFHAPSSSSYSPPPPLLHPRLSPSHHTEAATSKVSGCQLWFVVMATQFSLSPALTWEVVKNVDGCHQRSVKKRPWCSKRGSSERLLNPDVLSFLHHRPVAGWFFFFFNLWSLTDLLLKRSLLFALTAGPAILFTQSLALNIHDAARLTLASDRAGIVTLI